MKTNTFSFIILSISFLSTEFSWAGRESHGFLPMPAILTCKQASCPDFEVLLPYPDMKISVAQIFQNGVQIAEFTCIDVKHRKQMTSELQETVYCQGRWGDQTVDDQMILSESLISSELRLFRTGLEGAETTLRLPCD